MITGAARDRTFSVASQIGLACWAAVVIVPMLWTLMSSFKATDEIFSSSFSLPGVLHLENYAGAWTTAGIGRYFVNTVIVVGVALAMVMMLGAMCAYVLARFNFPGRRVIYYVLLAGLTFPIFLAIVPLFRILDQLMLLGTLPGLIVTYIAFALPFTVFFLFSFFRSLPDEVAEAAAIDGAGAWTTFFQIMLPMARNGIFSVTIFNFLGLWNQFLLPVALNNSDQSNWVLSQGMAAYASQAGYAVDFGQLFAAVVITVLPVLVIYVIFQRQLQSSVTQGAYR